jgi:hypothetical protein
MMVQLHFFSNHHPCDGVRVEIEALSRGVKTSAHPLILGAGEGTIE